MSLTRLSHQLPHALPSRFTTPHMPRSRAVPITATEAAHSGVSASTFAAPGFWPPQPGMDYLRRGEVRSKTHAYLDGLEHACVEQRDHRSLAQFRHRLKRPTAAASVYLLWQLAIASLYSIVRVGFKEQQRQDRVAARGPLLAAETKIDQREIHELPPRTGGRVFIPRLRFSVGRRSSSSSSSSRWARIIGI